MVNYHKYYVYIMTNESHSVIYIDVTHHLQNRITEHKKKKLLGFPKKYNVNKLLYLEEYKSIKKAIDREKQLKEFTPEAKRDLINKNNPDWNDISGNV